VENENKQTYQALIDKFLSKADYPDYPIMLTKSHEDYKSRFKDHELWEQIEKDVARTHSQMSFFSQKSLNPILIPYFT
jgi:hypothetical protein